MAFPINRMRRLRRTGNLRRLLKDVKLDASDLIMPFFVCEGNGIRKEIPSMPGIVQYSPDELVKDLGEINDLSIPAILLFGIPDKKDPKGSSAWAKDGIVQKTVRTVKQQFKELVVIADVCLCEYTSHGHCGPLDSSKDVDNDAALALLAKTATSLAQAGADMLAPSAMMDGQIKTIRGALDEGGFGLVSLMSYAAKYASSFYGPFRDAAESAPQFGNRRSYQMDSARSREALAEIELDIAEGADIVMVKPALAFLDIIRKARDAFTVPLAAYNVSGEYAMVKAAANKRWIDEKSIVLEIAHSIKRAGADIIITYHARDIARWLKDT